MNNDPFKEFSKPSEYHVLGDDEDQHLANITARINEVSRPQTRRRTIWYMSLAATILLLAALWFDNRPSQMEIAQTFFEPYQNYSSTQTRGAQEKANLIDFYQAYDEQDFDKAIKNYSLTDESKKALDQLYYAISLQGVNQWERASEVLEELRDEIPGEHDESLLYYSGLAHMATGKVEKAKADFSELVERPDSYYFSKAQKILAKLN